MSPGAPEPAALGLLATHGAFPFWKHRAASWQPRTATNPASSLPFCPGLCRSAHLAHECSQRGLQALLAAMQRSSLAGGGGGEASGAAAEGEAAAAHDGALDDLLFFADKEGDATVFGRCVGHSGGGSFLGVAVGSAAQQCWSLPPTRLARARHTCC